MTRRDVVIIGAGPAGSTAALLFARAGFDVLLIDRFDFPRAKPCGDCLSPQASIILERLGILARVHATQPALLDGWRIVAPSGHSFTARFTECGAGDARTACALALPRSRLDAALLAAARDAGVDVHTGVHVEELLLEERAVRARDRFGRRSVYHGRLIVGADGLRSIIARRIGAPRRAPRLRKISLTAHVENVRDAERFGEMHVADGSCAGLAPVGAGLWNLTIVALAQRHGRAIAADPMRFFVRSLAHFPELCARVESATIEGVPLAQLAAANRSISRASLLPSGPFDVATARIVADGVALTGDAAGYYDPFTGQGIFQALQSAEFLAEEAGAAMRNGGPSAAHLRSYERRHKRLVGEARLLQRAIESVLARPRFANAAVRRIGRTPALARALLAVTGDLEPAASLLSPLLLLSFAAPFLRRAPA